MAEDCKRKVSDRRANDRRSVNVTVEYDRRENQRRSGFDRRELLSGQV
tara:strand:- start:905 stop:1048 length:144 start_codon:yes stop_codon:yes gene_type:complete